MHILRAAFAVCGRGLLIGHDPGDLLAVHDVDRVEVLVFHGLHGVAGRVGIELHNRWRARYRVRSKDTAPIDIGDESGNVIIGGVGDDLLCRADLNNAPIFHNGDLVPEEKCLIEIMCDEDDGLFQRCLKA